jgi:uncharacterized protein
MFARRSFASLPSPPAAPIAPGGSPPAWLARLTNPYVGAGAAAVLMAGAAGALILFAGDPHAGAPSVRVALASPSAKDLDALHPLTPPPVMLDNLQPGQEVALTSDSSAQAQITLPQGASVSGGAPSSALTADAPSPAADATPPRPQSPPLPVAPISGLSAQTPAGLLPVIAKDGRTPWQAYARPFHDTGKPRVALVIGGLGLNSAATKTAIERLPPEVTLSFVPYADNLQGWIDLARANGHEVLLEAPMEPTDYPNNDPGPETLMASGSPAEMTKRLDWLLARASGYFGLTNYLGGKFMSTDAAMGGFIGQLKARGLAFVDDGSANGKGAGVPRASAVAVVDEQLSADSIDHALLGLEASALQHGSALGSGFAYPVTVEQVTRWAQGLAGRGYQLAPASAVLKR